MAIYGPNWNEIMGALVKAANAENKDFVTGPWAYIAEICGIPSDVDVRSLFNDSKWRFAVYHEESDGIVSLQPPR